MVKVEQAPEAAPSGRGLGWRGDAQKHQEPQVALEPLMHSCLEVHSGRFPMVFLRISRKPGVCQEGQQYRADEGLHGRLPIGRQMPGQLEVDSRARW